MKPDQTSRDCGGFTLVELLVSITIIIILATTVFVLFGRVSKAASAATMTNNFRQIGSAIRLYSDNNNSKLPGPLHTGQRAIWRDAPRTHLAYFLWEYFFPDQVPKEGQEMEMLSSPMWRKETPTRKGISMLSQPDVDPDPAVRRNPWGYAGAGQNDPNRNPITMAKLFSYDRLPWALVEADQLHPLVGVSGWRAELPAKPVHGNYRLAMFFDGSVGKRLLSEEFNANR